MSVTPTTTQKIPNVDVHNLLIKLGYKEADVRLRFYQSYTCWKLPCNGDWININKIDRGINSVLVMQNRTNNQPHSFELFCTTLHKLTGGTLKKHNDRLYVISRTESKIPIIIAGIMLLLSALMASWKGILQHAFH